MVVIDVKEHLTDRLYGVITDKAFLKQEAAKYYTIRGDKLYISEELFPRPFLEKMYFCFANPDLYQEREPVSLIFNPDDVLHVDQTIPEGRRVLYFIENFGVEEGLYKLCILESIAELGKELI